jgi:hypothetical protein
VLELCAISDFEGQVAGANRFRHRVHAGHGPFAVSFDQQGLTLSTSIAGRILQDLRQRRWLIEPLRAPRRSRRRLRPRPNEFRRVSAAGFFAGGHPADK